MLIINADDLGRQQAATDNTLACFTRHRLTSTSAMVFMRDSERAAELSLSAGIDVGLHINFSEPFTTKSVSDVLQNSHKRVCRFLRANKYALLIYHPLLHSHFQIDFQSQYEEFLRLYGRPPSHLDGHQHMHLATNMIIHRILPFGTKVRRSFSFQRHEKGLIKWCYRYFIDRQLSQRHRMTDYFFSLSQNMSKDRFERIIALSTNANVELMTHPQNQSEYVFLMNDSYGAAISSVRLASYQAL